MSIDGTFTDADLAMLPDPSVSQAALDFRAQLRGVVAATNMHLEDDQAVTLADSFFKTIEGLGHVEDGVITGRLLELMLEGQPAPKALGNALRFAAGRVEVVAPEATPAATEPSQAAPAAALTPSQAIAEQGVVELDVETSEAPKTGSRLCPNRSYPHASDIFHGVICGACYFWGRRNGGKLRPASVILRQLERASGAAVSMVEDKDVRIAQLEAIVAALAATDPTRTDEFELVFDDGTTETEDETTCTSCHTVARSGRQLRHFDDCLWVRARAAVRPVQGEVSE